MKSSKLYWLIFFIIVFLFSFLALTLTNLIVNQNYSDPFEIYPWYNLDGQGDYYQSRKYDDLIDYSLNLVDEIYINEQKLIKMNQGEFDEFLKADPGLEDLYYRYLLENNLETNYIHKGLIIFEDENYKDFQEEYKEEIQAIKNRLIPETKVALRGLKDSAKKIGLNYEIKAGDKVYYQHPENYNLFKNRLYLSRINGNLNASELTDTSVFYNMEAASGELLNGKDFTISIDDNMLDVIARKWNYTKGYLDFNIKFAIGLSLVIAIGFLYLVFTSRAYNWPRLKKVYVEVRLILILVLLFVGATTNLFAKDHYRLSPNIFDNSDIESVILLMGVSSLMAGLGLSMILSLIENIKDRSFIKNTLMYKIMTIFLKKDGSTADKFTLSSLFFALLVGIVIFIVGFSNIYIGTILFFIVVAVMSYFINIVSKDIENIKLGIIRAREGKLKDPVIIEDIRLFKNVGEDINTISEGLEKALEEELKSSRHRTELITNVSHDLRTPLTSIISYIDLLKFEKDEEKREEYLEILEDKAKRLNQIVDTLFEASKVDSGDMPVSLEEINLLSLLNQGLAEKEERLEEAELEIIITNKLENEKVIADGNLLWRALENVLSNIVKYSLRNSRVYIDLYNKDKKAYLEMKNLSRYQLNISEEELFGRFKRGDESRSSEGSGLGLSITKGLLELQNGKFTIDIDGDLFKSFIILNEVINSSEED